MVVGLRTLLIQLVGEVSTAPTSVGAISCARRTLFLKPRDSRTELEQQPHARNSAHLSACLHDAKCNLYKLEISRGLKHGGSWTTPPAR